MARWRAAFVAVVILAAALPASAATIGMSAGNADPIPITDPTWQPLLEGECEPDLFLPVGYRCARYDSGIEISSIDFRMKDGEGNLIPIFADITLDQFSFLRFLTPSPIFLDGVTFRLTQGDNALPPSVMVVTFFSNHENGDEDPAWVQIAAVNGVPNVPEPATLLMLGPAAVWALRRRNGRR
jgi:hypothetical protein